MGERSICQLYSFPLLYGENILQYQKSYGKRTRRNVKKYYLFFLITITHQELKMNFHFYAINVLLHDIFFSTACPPSASSTPHLSAAAFCYSTLKRFLIWSRMVLSLSFILWRKKGEMRFFLLFFSSAPFHSSPSLLALYTQPAVREE